MKYLANDKKGNIMSIREDIQKLKEEKGAIILAHYYVLDEVQEIADYVGDSFYLSKIAEKSDAKRIVFAGVTFMGESAKILSPDKIVQMPDMTALCPMAEMIDTDEIEKMRQEYDDLAVVCYINSTAETKTYCDVCVTSSNAVKIVKSLPNKNIYFIPDRNLGSYVAEQVPEKNVILGNGFCPRHQCLTPDEVIRAKKLHPDALFLAHPECVKEVLDLADYIGSTKGIIEYATESECQEFIIGTVEGVFYELKKRNPGKKFYTVSTQQICINMKKVTLEKVYNVLNSDSNQMEVSDECRQKALIPLERMLELAAAPEANESTK